MVLVLTGQQTQFGQQFTKNVFFLLVLWSIQISWDSESVCVHWIYLIHKFQNLSWITEVNSLFHDILIYWDAPLYPTSDAYHPNKETHV